MTATILPIDAPEKSRRALLIATGVMGGAAATAAVLPLVATFAPSERAKAGGAAVEVDIGNLAEGAMTTVEWRGKPVWIVRRSAAMRAVLEVPDARLADPESSKPQQPDYAKNPTRSINSDIFIAVGICTHLGCSPSMVPGGSNNASVGEDWHGGFYCPCHGSTFDGAGRVYKNKPAPINLEIPPHRYLSATRILIGEDTVA